MFQSISGDRRYFLQIFVKFSRQKGCGKAGSLFSLLYKFYVVWGTALKSE